MSYKNSPQKDTRNGENIVTCSGCDFLVPSIGTKFSNIEVRAESITVVYSRNGKEVSSLKSVSYSRDGICGKIVLLHSQRRRRAVEMNSKQHREVSNVSLIFTLELLLITSQPFCLKIIRK